MLPIKQLALYLLPVFMGLVSEASAMDGVDLAAAAARAARGNNRVLRCSDFIKFLTSILL
jgi:hypothetical protein